LPEPECGIQEPPKPEPGEVEVKPDPNIERPQTTIAEPEVIEIEEDNQLTLDIPVEMQKKRKARRALRKPRKRQRSLKWDSQPYVAPTQSSGSD